MVTLSGKAIYVGYLKACTVYADLNGDMEHNEGEPESTTGEYGGWSLTVPEAAQAFAEVIVPASSDCIDRNTNLSLPVTIQAVAGCEIPSVLSHLKNSLVKAYVAQNTSKVDATEKADRTMVAALGLTDEPDFNACTFDPIEQLWGTQSGDGRRLEETKDVIAAGFGLILQVVSVVSGVASVTGFKSDDAYETSVKAALKSVADQLIKHAEKANNTAAGDPVDIDTMALVTMAEAAANVTLGESLAAALANSTAATADYVTNATKTGVTLASDDLFVALTTIATVGVVGQTHSPGVDALLKEARAAGHSDFSLFSSVANLTFSLFAASTPEALKGQAAAVIIPAPEEAPSPSPPPSPPYSPTPASPPPLPDVGTLNSDKGLDSNEMNSSALASLVLLLPVLCLGFLCFRYPGNVGLWFKYHFSHSNPTVMILYKPREAREKMRRTLADANQLRTRFEVRGTRNKELALNALTVGDLEESMQRRSAAEEPDLEEFSTTHPAKTAEPVSVRSSREYAPNDLMSTRTSSMHASPSKTPAPVRPSAPDAAAAESPSTSSSTPPPQARAFLRC